MKLNLAQMNFILNEFRQVVSTENGNYFSEHPQARNERYKGTNRFNFVVDEATFPEDGDTPYIKVNVLLFSPGPGYNLLATYFIEFNVKTEDGQISMEFNADDKVSGTGCVNEKIQAISDSMVKMLNERLEDIKSHYFGR